MAALYRGRAAGDVTVVGSLALLALATAYAGTRAGGDQARAWWAFAAELVSLAALTRRRRRPLAVVALTAAGAVAAAVIADRTVIGPLLPAFALYTLGTRASWRLTACATAAVIGAYGGAAALRHGLAAVAAAVAVCSVAAAVGLYVGEHRRLAERAAAEQRLLAAQAVLDERVWIARELHDVIGHHVSLLVVQAGAVQATLTEDHPARPVATAMIDVGREAMTEMRRLVDVLRPVESGARGAATDDQGERAPMPGLAELPALCGRLRAAGLPVEVCLDVPVPPPPAAGMTAYRIVQEALTNVMKHAGDVATRVEVTQTDDILDIRVTNEPPGTPPASLAGGGHGLPGIRRRAGLFGGEVFAGPVPGGGYALRATLRLREPS